jgi:hypothetical protein
MRSGFWTLHIGLHLSQKCRKRKEEDRTKRERKGNKIQHETIYKEALKRKNFQEDGITDTLKINIRFNR